MSVNSKQKGSRGERELASYLREHGFKTARRTQQYAGNTGEASDIACVELGNWHIENKRCERVLMRDWVAQCERDSRGGKWLLFHRWNHGQQLVTLKADDLMELLRESLL